MGPWPRTTTDMLADATVDAASVHGQYNGLCLVQIILGGEGGSDGSGRDSGGKLALPPQTLRWMRRSETLRGKDEEGNSRHLGLAGPSPDDLERTQNGRSSSSSSKLFLLGICNNNRQKRREIRWLGQRGHGGDKRWTLAVQRWSGHDQARLCRAGAEPWKKSMRRPWEKMHFPDALGPV